MKKLIYFLAIFLIIALVGSCSTKEASQQNVADEKNTPETTDTASSETSVSPEDLYTVSDFTPPTGKADGPDDFNAWNSRLLFATSTDGLTWTRTDQLITDQANIPSVVLKDGRIFVYFVTWVEELRNQIAVAISNDQGKSWIFKEVHITGRQGNPTDPDVVLLDDGRFRLYYTSQIPGVSDIETFSAISDDGITFTLEEGTRISAAEDGANVVNVKVMKVGDILHLYGLNEYGPDGLYHATSSDGVTFTKQDTIDENMILSSAVALDDGYRFYGFKHSGSKDVKYSFEIDSWTSEDGFTWVMDEGARLVFDGTSAMERMFVKDPAVTQLDDGTYMMFYISAIPDE